MSQHSNACHLALLVALCAPFDSGAEPPGGRFDAVLDTRAIGAAAFRERHPTWDGRGAVIAVCDTGVDMGVAGLRTTTDGKPKVIVARDFSAQGEIDLATPSAKVIDGVRWLAVADGKVRGFESLPDQPEDGEKGFRLGFVHESRFRESQVTDLNKNGHDRDAFAVLVFRPKGKGKGPVAYVDLDGNGDLTGARPLRSFEVAQETFAFTVRDPEFDRAPAAFALYLDPSLSRIELHFDDGGHGTHVAGIAAGHGLMGRSGFDGIAPGAQVMSLKIGDNTLAGGATTTESMRRAIEFAGKWSQDHGTPVIVNLSYGIGSELKGKSDIDETLDEVLGRYPLLSAAVSAGNEGPGIGSIGTPAGSKMALVAGALLPRESAATLFGAALDRDRIFPFSSRGGEIPKPDVIAPGVASASTPPWDVGDIKAGTSMASPQIAGLLALLASAATHDKVKFTGGTLRRAVIGSARPIAGYGPLDQGAGLPDAERALKLVRDLARHDEPFQVLHYELDTQVPTSPNGQGQAAYFRAGTWLPDPGVGHEVHVAAHLTESARKHKDGFQQLITFRTETPWLRTDRGSLRLIGEGHGSVSLWFDKRAVTKPGVHVGRLDAYPDDGGGVAAFSIWATAIVPHVFDRTNGYALSIRDARLAPGDVARYPLLVPPGATQMEIALTAQEARPHALTATLLDRNGHLVRTFGNGAVRGEAARMTLSGRALEPGVYELAVTSTFRARGLARFTLDVAFHGLEAAPLTRARSSAGENPRADLVVTNRYDDVFDGSASGSLIGFRRTHSLKVDGDQAEHTFSMNGDVSSVDLVLTLSPTHYARFTDVAVLVHAPSGEIVHKGGFNFGRLEVSVPNRGPGRYRLVVRGGLAREGGPKWTLEVTETLRRKSPIVVSGGNGLRLFPDVPKTIRLTFAHELPQIPEGYVGFGEVRLVHDATRQAWLTVPIELQ